ncbi:quinone oxidoreductase family protein [Albimonas pacifica]|uniref:NADPH:quinone reductase n=1 Tax=Albimonas pacifica TaxID=1114924 RepID=A0A1I3FU43_9RHOB|nr:zinc-binding alcohol dehydrogenase family protein [Albimonas pacifica]SFI14760.1 NADPH:quinone reductase [Albimonas pacifica]
MKAAVYDDFGPPAVLRSAEIADPAPGPDEVLIDVAAISIEGGDLIRRRTTTPPRRGYVVGYASAGTVVAVGSAATRRAVGDRVTVFADEGSHAALRAVPEAQTWRIPDGLDFARASALPISFGTAHHCLFARGALKAGETVLVQAGAGGVGTAAIQLARRAGATVVAVASGAERLAKLTALGADHVVDRRSEDVVAAVAAATGGKGADLVVDPVGATLQTSLRALRPEGRLVFVGNAGGGTSNPDLWPAMAANQSLLGVFMGPLFTRPEVAATVDRMLADVADGVLDVAIDREFALEAAAEAHDHAERGRPFGRVVMRP